MHYQIYVDEAGNTPYYNDEAQPVSAWGGVITNKSEGDFDKEVRFLLKEFGLPEETEFHAYEIFQNKGPFEFLINENRELILLKFLSIGIQYIDYYYACDDLNCYRKPEDRLKFESRNLSILERLLFLFITQVDFYLHNKLDATYSFYFDKSGDFYKSKKLILKLKEFSETHYYLRGLQGEPNKLDSNKNRFIQLADVICDNRKKLALLTKTFTGRNKFIKHEAFIKNCHQIIKSKEMPFVKSFAANLEFFENSNDPKVIEFKKMSRDWMTRDFRDISGLQAKKKKSDIFNHSVNTFWEEKNEEFNLVKTLIVEIIEDKRINLNAVNAEIRLEVLLQFYELLVGKFRKHSFLPEFEKLKNKTEELIKKIINANNLSLNETSAGAIQKAIEALREFNLIPQDEEAIIRSFNENLNNLILNLAQYVCELKAFDNKLNEILRRSISEINPENKLIPREIYYVKEPTTSKKIKDFIQDYNEYIKTICYKLTLIYNSNLFYFQSLPNEIESELTFQKVYIEKVINAIKEAIDIIFRKLRQFHGVIDGFKVTNIEISKVINAGRENNLQISELLNKINDIMNNVKISRKFLNF